MRFWKQQYECPRCGCNEARKVDIRTRPWGRGKVQQLECTACNQWYTLKVVVNGVAKVKKPAPEPETLSPVVDLSPPSEVPDVSPREEASPTRGCVAPALWEVSYESLHCPACHAADVVVISSPARKEGQPKIRYHHCRHCSRNFRSAQD